LIVDFANHLKEKGMDITETLVEAGRERLRPIIIFIPAFLSAAFLTLSPFHLSVSCKGRFLA
jgi:multidrug efflux pump subunit AcrB